MRRRGALAGVAVVATLLALAVRHASGAAAAPPARQPDRVIRVALSGVGRSPVLGATGRWELTDDARSVQLRAGSGDVWSVERTGGMLRVVRRDGTPTSATRGPIVARPVGDAVLAVGSRHYRGELVVYATDSGLLVVNRVPVEEYLRGVVPLEIGRRPPEELAAAEAQAVAARSYAVTHLSPSAGATYDVTDGVMHQVYGGADAEQWVTDAAVVQTAGLVLTFAGRTIYAPYSAVCGGSTAAASEVWRSADEPYLRPVSDRIPGSDRFYCDASPKFAWTRTFDRASLAATLDRYLRAYAAPPPGGLGTVRTVEVEGQTPSGRVRSLGFVAGNGRASLRGNDIRFVLRTPGGEILPSTYFSVDLARDRDGAVRTLTLAGRGNGHGVGMCQWGAIGRARAGQDFRTILRTYYPGTTVEPAR